MPAGLVNHLRYPEDLFKVQSDHFADYHVTDAPTFYQNSRQWAVAQDPGGAGRLANPTTATSAPVPGRPAVTPAPARRARMEPYYLLMRLPGQDKESFLILQPFVPVGAGDQELPNLSAFMVAKSDPGEYGRLEAYTMPVGSVVQGPAQIDAIIAATPEFSERRTLLDRPERGSELIQGSLLLIPIEQSILYVRPLYTQGTGDTQIPEFKFIAAVYGNRAVIGETVQVALAKLFPDLGPAPPPPGPAPPGGPSPPPSGAVAGLLAQAESVYSEAQTALRNGDLAAYQRAVDRVGELIRQARTASETTTMTAPGR